MDTRSNQGQPPCLHETWPDRACRNSDTREQDFEDWTPGLKSGAVIGDAFSIRSWRRAPQVHEEPENFGSPRVTGQQVWGGFSAFASAPPLELGP